MQEEKRVENNMLMGIKKPDQVKHESRVAAQKIKKDSMREQFMLQKVKKDLRQNKSKRELVEIILSINMQNISLKKKLTELDQDINEVLSNG